MRIHQEAMMRITPLDIRKQEFRRTMRGLDTEEVYAFLTTVADEYEAILNDNKALKERLLELDDKVQEYRNMEKTLRNTLLTAERVNVEAKENARREAGLIIKEAEIEAEQALRNIRNDQIALRSSIQELKRQKESYISRIRMVAEAHLSFIRSAENDMEDDDIAVDSLPKTEPNAWPEPATRKIEAVRPAPIAAPERELPPIADEPSVPADEAGPPEASAEEETSLFPSIPGSVGGMAAPKPAPEYAGASSVPDLNDILERIAASRPEVSEIPEPVQPVPAPQPAPAAVSNQPSAPAADKTPAPAPTEKAPVTASTDSGEEWSLERLKRDILSGAPGERD
jgi:cell division initiation protein